ATLWGAAALSESLDGGAPFEVAVANGVFSLPVPLAADGSADGAHSISFVAIDAAGNATLPLTFDFTLDTRAPVIALAPTSIQDGGTLDLASHLTGTVDPTGSQLTALGYRFDNGVVVPIAFDPATGAFDAALDLTTLTTGAHTLTLTALDGAGNVTSQTLALSLPALPPLTITSITPTNGADDVGVTYRPMVTF